MALPTVDEIRNIFLEGYDITTSIASDSFIERRRDKVVVPFVENFIRTSISTQQTAVEYYNGNGTTTLILNRRNIVSLTKIELVGVQDIIGTISLASIEIIPDQGILKAKTTLSEGAFFALFPKGKRNIKVTYVHGGTLDDDVAEAIGLLTAVSVLDHVGNRTGGGALGVQAFSRNYGAGSKYTNAIKSMRNEAITILNRYSSGVVG